MRVCFYVSSVITRPLIRLACAFAPAIVPPPGSQHSYFTALAKNSHLRTVFTALRAAASRPKGEGFKTVSHRGHLAGAGMFRAGAGMFRAVSTAADFSTNARNDIVFVCFYTAGGLRPMFNTAEREKSYVFSARRFLMKCAKTVRRKTKTVLRVRRGFTIGRVFNAVRKKRPPKGS